MNKRLIVYSVLAACCAVGMQAVRAEALADKYWPGMQKNYFPNASIEESGAIKISAPTRAEDAAQVPLEISVDHPMAAGNYIKTVSVIADANPVPLLAVYHFSPRTGKAEVSTRIRIDADTYVHVVAETSDGKFLMAKVPIKASGGCGGTVTGDPAIARQSAGQIKIAVKPETGAPLQDVHLLIRHPMNTGMQKDAATQGFIAPFFINRVVAKYDDQVVFDADTSFGMSEDPNIEFPFKADRPGKLTVEIRDNEGKAYSASSQVSMN